MFCSIYMYMKCHVASSESACRQLDDYPSSTDTQYKTNQICKSFIFISDAASKSRAIERRMHAIRRSRAFQRMHVMLDRFIHLQNLPRYMPGFLPSKASTNTLPLERFSIWSTILRPNYCNVLFGQSEQPVLPRPCCATNRADVR